MGIKILGIEVVRDVPLQVHFYEVGDYVLAPQNISTNHPNKAINLCAFQKIIGYDYLKIITNLSENQSITFNCN